MGTILLLLGLLALILVLSMLNKRESYGQDASIRMAAGLAGPDLGDPIGVFARQIEEAKMDYFRKYGRMPPYRL